MCSSLAAGIGAPVAFWATASRYRLFIGPAFQQAGETTFGWPDLRPITDLASASRAIERIVEQGEGARGDCAKAHYGRFLALLEEYRARHAEDPAFQPAHRSPPRR